MYKLPPSLVPTLQRGNACTDTPALSPVHGTLERPTMRSRAGARERVIVFLSLRSQRLCERHIFLIPIILLSVLFLTACKEEKTTGAAEVRWDREICARCAMAVSDRSYSAQVRGGKPEKKTKLYKFDDVGCAIIWLDDQNWKDDPRTEVWVNHYQTGEWINAETAWYVEMNNTPMDYGLGAQVVHEAGAIDFEQAKKHIYKVEERFNLHKGVPLLPAEEKQ